MGADGGPHNTENNMTLKKELHVEIGRLEEETYALKTRIGSALAHLEYSQFLVPKILKIMRENETSGYSDERIKHVIKGVRRAVRTLSKLK